MKRDLLPLFAVSLICLSGCSSEAPQQVVTPTRPPEQDSPPATTETPPATKTPRPAPPPVASTEPLRPVPAANTAREDSMPARIANVKQILLALHAYAFDHRHLPPAYAERDGKPLLGWRVAVLPYLKQQALHDKFDFKAAWDDPANKQQGTTPLEIYGGAGNTRYLLLTGVGTAFDGTKTLDFPDIRDGTSNTVILVEVAAEKAVPWASPADIEVDLKNPLDSVGPIPDEGLIVGFADGRVEVLPKTITSDQFRGLVTVDGGEPYYKKELKPPYRPSPANALKDILLAFHNYDLRHSALPAAAFEKDGKPTLSWRVALLPHLEKLVVYDRFNWAKPWDSPENGEWSATNVPQYGEGTKTRFLVFTGPGTLFDGNKHRPFGTMAGNTILVIQVATENAVEWASPVDIKFDPENPMAGIGPIPDEGILVGMADGSVHRLPKTITPEEFRGLVIAADGKPPYKFTLPVTGPAVKAPEPKVERDPKAGQPDRKVAFEPKRETSPKRVEVKVWDEQALRAADVVTMTAREFMALRGGDLDPNEKFVKELVGKPVQVSGYVKSMGCDAGDSFLDRPELKGKFIPNLMLVAREDDSKPADNLNYDSKTIVLVQTSGELPWSKVSKYDKLTVRGIVTPPRGVVEQAILVAFEGTPTPEYQAEALVKSALQNPQALRALRLKLIVVHGHVVSTKKGDPIQVLVKGHGRDNACLLFDAFASKHFVKDLSPGDRISAIGSLSLSGETDFDYPVVLWDCGRFTPDPAKPETR